MEPKPTVWWLRPVSSAARVAEPGVVDQHQQHVGGILRRPNVTDLSPVGCEPAKVRSTTPWNDGRRIGRLVRSIDSPAMADASLRPLQAT
jgi:hypothetical protein